MGASWAAHGRGTPVTLVVHGLGATEGEARIPASGLPGTRVVLALPGHGSADDAPPDYWNYASIAADVLAVADEVEATRAVGVSLGAGALTRIAAEHPDRFERLALLLPAALDRPREVAATWAFERLAAAVAAGGETLRETVAADLPEGVEVGDYVERRAEALLRLEDALRELPEQVPVPDAAVLAGVRSEVLVVGATDDPLHPAEVAKAVAAAFARARLEILPSPAPMLTHRRELRRLLVDFLG
ncbi:Pimeloyl-ACP methyl ester carboxylesterase [Saccharopolyspora shandongensis]|uniref:Pimeloyl-ACP methyl ester carboxylesterase n=1 Tax=Saccharopolyspora shandongensis TaxID=418495 RepID=A0A1H3J9A4_9PSEU|nr:alpha/beta hydrolase [Saccharopolyspora shandongensis]SDY36541.1 Pimeloyl-ACP methyl ester carboxylesterase [Saccharopolyspora shandongensis]